MKKCYTILNNGTYYEKIQNIILNILEYCTCVSKDINKLNINYKIDIMIVILVEYLRKWIKILKNYE